MTGRRRTWPARPRPFACDYALTLAAYLSDRPVGAGSGHDANRDTHTHLRCTSLRGHTVHIVASTRTATTYVTACGLRVAKGRRRAHRRPGRLRLPRLLARIGPRSRIPAERRAHGHIDSMN